MQATASLKPLTEPAVQITLRVPFTYRDRIEAFRLKRGFTSRNAALAALISEGFDAAGV